MLSNEANERTEATQTTVPDASLTRAIPIRVWLVDDNQMLRDTFKELLAAFQEIECTGGFPSASAALSALASRTGPDVVLLDVQMGNENGLDAIRPIRSLSRSTRVLMLTTFYDRDWHSRAVEDGASGFLLKRYAVEQIVESIRRANSEPVSYRSPPRSRTKVSRAPQPPGNPGKEVIGKQVAETPSARRRFTLFDQCLAMFRSRN